MNLKIRLAEEKEWDREIIKWLKSIPSGYRATVIKKTLYAAIRNLHKEYELSSPKTEEGGLSRENQLEEELNKKIDAFLKF